MIAFLAFEEQNGVFKPFVLGWNLNFGNFPLLNYEGYYAL